MEGLFNNLKKSADHLEILHNLFSDSENFNQSLKSDFEIYMEQSKEYSTILETLNIPSQLYGEKGRQMILADIIEYILLSRGLYSLKKPEDKKLFIKSILKLVNLLMSYELLTISDGLRKEYCKQLKEKIPDITEENLFYELENFSGIIGLPNADVRKDLSKYFDTLLPKTAGGLWHELLVYVFLLRLNIGYIVPLLLSQRLHGLQNHLVPPDFLIITYQKQIFGVEVGIKKEIQSGSFSLQTAIPTATIDTINSRTSDRCPICKKWIQICPYVIDNFSNFEIEIEKPELRCLDIDCPYFSKEEIANGQCPYTKYSRKKADSKDYTHHSFSDGKHYHYQCVLENVDGEMRKRIIDTKDSIALKTHYPHYQGIEALIEKR